MALLHTPLPPRLFPTTDIPLAAATIVTVLAGLLGAALDTAHGSPARTLFAIFLAIGAGAATARVQRERLLAAVVMVPLAYLALLLVGGLTDGSYLYWLATAFIVKAPVVLVATTTAAVVALVRRTAC